MQALMLAAGMGKRLGKYTEGNTKCMLKIQDKTLLERAMESCYKAGIKKFVIVLGYKGENVKDFLEKSNNPIVKNMDIVFINNENYDKTNNIYSLYLGKDELIKDDTILLESDLIYEDWMIQKLIDSEEPNIVSVAKYKQWMDGTVIKIDNNNNITEFIEKKDFNFKEIDKYYKTINVYKFSKDFTKEEFVPFLEAYIKAYGENEYYELILKIIAHLSRSQLKAMDFSNLKWYEIDDSQDLDIVNCLFSEGKEKLENYQKRYGGYWRFDNLLDYCYLVNPYYPPQKMIDKIDYFSTNLLTQYPSGQNVESINAARLFNYIDEKNICVGNGAAELINALGRNINGKMLVSKNVFNEYMRCFKNCNFSILDMSINDYRYNVEEIIEKINENDIICIVNPDNPTGAFIKNEEMIKILDVSKQLNKLLIFDESFIDFADRDERYTLINNEILENYKNLVVIKSISKSYGIPGIRLGVLATANKELMDKIKKDISIWNINSYGEYFLQIANLYKIDYIEACDKIAEERSRFINDLKIINSIKVYDSQANYVLCQLLEKNSTEIAIKLLNENIFIKDLRTKDSFKNNDYIRLAIRKEEENKTLVKVLKRSLKD